MSTTQEALLAIVELGVKRGLWSVTRAPSEERDGSWNSWRDVTTPGGMVVFLSANTREGTLTASIGNIKDGDEQLTCRDVLSYSITSPRASFGLGQDPEKILKAIQRRVLNAPEWAEVWGKLTSYYESRVRVRKHRQEAADALKKTFGPSAEASHEASWRSDRGRLYDTTVTCRSGALSAVEAEVCASSDEATRVAVKARGLTVEQAQRVVEFIAQLHTKTSVTV